MRHNSTRPSFLVCCISLLALFIGVSFTAHAQERELDAIALGKLIDKKIEQRLDAENVEPAPIAGDAEFLRRVYLDVTGKIPHASAVRDFLNDESPDKRERVVDELLESPSYIIHYTNLWRAAMIPEADADPQIQFALPGFEAWLRSRIAENRNFAEIVEEMLTLPIDQESVIGFQQPNEPTPAAFYRAKEAKPERLAASTARLFLGVRIDCAQCHDHPFDDWKQEQFWKHAAFFTDIPQIPIPGQEMQARKESAGTIAIPDKDTIVEATFLTSSDAVPKSQNRNREALAEWIISEKNPYFAKAAANRIWSYHFGVGLVEPMDDFSPHNPASHPELLELLADAFVASNYNFKFMIRAITSSQTYQRSSQSSDDSQQRLSLFARMPVRGMTAEQIFDSLAVAIGYRQPFDPEQPLNFNNDQSRQEFLANFGSQTESAPDRTTTILQALSLMNGDFVGDATDIADSRTLAAVIDSPFLNLGEKIESMYLSTMSRKPTDEELQTMLTYASQANDPGADPDDFADIFWVLLNSSEFLLNH